MIEAKANTSVFKTVSLVQPCFGHEKVMSTIK